LAAHREGVLWRPLHHRNGDFVLAAKDEDTDHIVHKLGQYKDQEKVRSGHSIRYKTQQNIYRL
jgi:hypothetical protein